MKLRVPVVHVDLSERGLITFTALIACSTLIGFGHNHFVGYTLLGVVGGYYGVSLPFQIITRRNGKQK